MTFMRCIKPTIYSAVTIYPFPISVVYQPILKCNGISCLLLPSSVENLLHTKSDRDRVIPIRSQGPIESIRFAIKQFGALEIAIESFRFDPIRSRSEKDGSMGISGCRGRSCHCREASL